MTSGLEMFADLVKDCMKVLKQRLGLHRKDVEERYHFTHNTLDKRLKNLDKLTLDEFLSLVGMLLDTYPEGAARSKALLDIMSLFLYRGDEARRMSLPGDPPLFPRHPLEELEEMWKKLRIDN